MSKNMCNLRHKVRNGQNLPNENPNFTSYFFLSNFTYNFGHFSTNLRLYYQNIFFQNPGCLVTCVFGVTNCLMPKRASVQLVHGQMNLDLMILTKNQKIQKSKGKKIYIYIKNKIPKVQKRNKNLNLKKLHSIVFLFSPSL